MFRSLVKIFIIGGSWHKIYVVHRQLGKSKIKMGKIINYVISHKYPSTALILI